MIPTREGALYWISEKTLLVADLHLGQGRSLASRGSLIPPYDTQATLLSLKRLVERFAPRRIISLGDSFHDDRQAKLLEDKEKILLEALMKGREWLWITGNHDPEKQKSISGEVAASFEIGGLTLMHHPLEEALEEKGFISGHLHPAASLIRSGRRVKCKCYALNSWQMVLPGFGSYTGGLDIAKPAFKAMRQCPEFTVWMIGARGVYRLSGEKLQPRRAMSTG